MQTCTVLVLAASTIGLKREERCTANILFAFFRVLGNEFRILPSLLASFKRRWRSSISVTAVPPVEKPREIPRRVLIVLTSASEILGMEPNSPSCTVLFSQSSSKEQPRQRGFKCQSILARGRERIFGRRRNKKSSRDGLSRLILMLLRSSNEGVDSESNPLADGSQIAALPAGWKKGSGRR